MSHIADITVLQRILVLKSLSLIYTNLIIQWCKHCTLWTQSGIRQRCLFDAWSRTGYAVEDVLVQVKGFYDLSGIPMQKKCKETPPPPPQKISLCNITSRKNCQNTEMISKNFMISFLYNLSSVMLQGIIWSYDKKNKLKERVLALGLFKHVSCNSTHDTSLVHAKP